MNGFFGLDLVTLIRTVGYAGLFGIIFAESGLLLGFFLPGDSLLFTAGFLASQGYLDIWILVIGCALAAILGDNIGYAFGQRVGPRLFTRPRSFLFKPTNLETARRFYAIHGGKTIVLARFIPAIRTFAPILAGVGRMEYRRFFFYNLVGAGFWAVGMPLLGFFLGSVIPGVDRYLLPIVLVIITLSIVPSLLPILRDKEYRMRLRRALDADISHYPLARKILGVALVAFGLFALAVPFFPFGWVIFIGLELLGFRVLFLERLRRWLSRRRQSLPTFERKRYHGDNGQGPSS